MAKSAVGQAINGEIVPAITICTSHTTSKIPKIPRTYPPKANQEFKLGLVNKKKNLPGFLRSRTSNDIVAPRKISDTIGLTKLSTAASCSKPMFRNNAAKSKTPVEIDLVQR